MLICSILSLFLGPLLYGYAERSNLAIKFIDGFAFVALAGLILFSQIIFTDNLSATFILIMVLGFLGPNLIEKILSRHSQSVHKVILLLALIGLVFHSFADGAGLIHDHEHNHNFIPLAVVLHKIPDGVCLWWLVRPHLGKKISWLMITALAISTAIGFYFSDLAVASHPESFKYLQAFVAGSILHVVFFRLHFHKEHDPINACCEDEDKHHWIESVGNFLAILFLLFLCFHEEDLNYTFFKHFWALFVETAPALIFAHLLAVLISAYLPRGSIEWLKKGGRFSQALKGTLIGLPLPICSCGVLPLYSTLLARGAPMTAALAFLIATPSVGLDSILISFPFLGIELSLIRFVVAAILAIAVGMIVAEKPKKSLLVINSQVQDEKEKDLMGSVKYSFFDVVRDTAPWIIMGIGIASLIDQHQDLLRIETYPFLQNFIIACLSSVMYICAVESLPIASALLKAGVSAGSIVIFLLLGPATNFSSFLMLKNLHGKIVAIKFVLVCLIFSLMAGAIIDLYYVPSIKSSNQIVEVSHNIFWAIILGTWYMVIFLRIGARRFFNLSGTHQH